MQGELEFWTLLFPVLLLAAALDWRTRVIPNWLTLAALVVGLGRAALPGGVALSAAAGGAALGLGFGFVLYALGALGGGDAKLLAAVGAFLGPLPFLNGLVLVIGVGGVMALGAVVRRRALRATLRTMGSIVLSLVTFGLTGRRVTLRSEGAIAVPYGIAIALGITLAHLGGLA